MKNCFKKFVVMFVTVAFVAMGSVSVYAGGSVHHNNTNTAVGVGGAGGQGGTGVGFGGAGGQGGIGIGGQGGVGLGGTGVGFGGSVTGSGNSNNKNLNFNSATGGNAKAGAYATGGSSKVKNSGNSSNKIKIGLSVGVDLKNKIDNTNKQKQSLKNINDLSNKNSNKQGQDQSQIGINKQGQDQNQKQNNKQGQGQSTDNANNSAQNVTVEGDVVVYEDNFKPTASSAYAPALAASTGTCLGSISGGASTVPFGISLGGTTKDEDCNVRKNTMLLHGLGLKKEAIRLMCAKSEDLAAAIGEEGCTAVGVKKKEEVAFFHTDDADQD